MILEHVKLEKKCDHSCPKMIYVLTPFFFIFFACFPRGSPLIVRGATITHTAPVSYFVSYKAIYAQAFPRGVQFFLKLSHSTLAPLAPRIDVARLRAFQYSDHTNHR